jgi:hypothetical protein
MVVPMIFWVIGKRMTKRMTNGVDLITLMINPLTALRALFSQNRFLLVTYKRSPRGIPRAMEIARDIPTI